MRLTSCQHRIAILVIAQVAAVATVPAAIARGEDLAQAKSPIDFDQAIAPILIRNCLECHQGDDPAGGLDLSSGESFKAGGDSGPPLAFEQPRDGLLWQKIESGEMPPESDLSEDDQGLIARWIDSGAFWSNRTLDPYELTTDNRAGYDWWSLQPISDPPVPDLPSNPEFDRASTNPIDAFVIEKLNTAGLAMSPRADARTLVRRLWIKMHGLHADPATVQRLANRPTDKRFDTLVDEVLRSHRYGERWARHWLDVARFGESQGFERDKSRPNAWRYRDWVIDALNTDMPYDQFARMQIAGDCIAAAGRDGVIATGFLVAGAWDEVGQNQQSAAMKKIVRQDEMEDYVGTVGQTFLGLTTNCARCHDHKFDPIRQSEYYSLASALDGVHHGVRDVTPPDKAHAAQQKQAKARQRLQELESELAEFEKPILAEITKQSLQRLETLDSTAESSARFVCQPTSHWDFRKGLEDQIGKLHASLRDGAKLVDGAVVVDGKHSHVVTKPLAADIVEKTLAVRVTLDHLDQRGGGAMTLFSTKKGQFDSIVFGEREPKKWMAGSENFLRSKNLGTPDEAVANNRSVHMAITYGADGTVSLFRDGVRYGASYRTKKPPRYKKGESALAFGIRLFPAGSNRMLAGRIHEASLYDRKLDEGEVRLLADGAAFITDKVKADHMSELQRKKWSSLHASIKAIRERDLSFPRELTYCVKPSEPPEVTRVLLRGNPTTPGEVVSAKGISSLQGTDWDFELAPNAPEAARRRMLADWIANRQNPLFARVIVNRIWQHHFGRGLVATPNDFGFSGGQPTHPELLDFLASRLIESNWSLKSLHRLILSSDTWKQATAVNRAAESIDSGNRLLWRGNRTRLDAESIRDSILFVAAQLNDKVGGPSYQDFKTFNFNSQFYDMTDPIGEAFNRRTVYRMVIRSGRNRMLDAFDCPDPSSAAPKRAVTTTPIQALSLMNHSFVLRMSDHFADRVRTEAGDDPDRAVCRAVEIAWCRQPTRTERDSFVRFTSVHGLPALCRILINSNEFLYVD